SLALQLPAGSHSQSTPDRLEVGQPLPFRAKSRAAPLGLNGTGRILFLREIIFAAPPLWMRTLAPSSAKMERLCGQRMAETLGQPRLTPVASVFSNFPLPIPISEPLSAMEA